MVLRGRTRASACSSAGTERTHELVEEELVAGPPGRSTEVTLFARAPFEKLALLRTEVYVDGAGSEGVNLSLHSPRSGLELRDVDGKLSEDGRWRVELGVSPGDYVLRATPNNRGWYFPDETPIRLGLGPDVEAFLLPKLGGQLRLRLDAPLARRLGGYVETRSGRRTPLRYGTNSAGGAELRTQRPMEPLRQPATVHVRGYEPRSIYADIRPGRLTDVDLTLVPLRE